MLVAQTSQLQEATYRDDLNDALRLIRSGANVNVATDLGVTPLWNASLNGNIVLVDALLERGANPNRALLQGETPLMIAARSGHTAIVERLLAKGALLNLRGPRGQTALMWAAAQKRAAAVNVLLKHGADLSLRSSAWSEMMAVPPHGYPAYNKLIPHGGQTALVFAARAGDFESVKLLVAAGANVNDADAWGVTATNYAAFSGFAHLVEYLLDHGANPNFAAAGFAPLHCAIMRRDERMVRALLSHGANPNLPVKAWTPTRRSSNDLHFEPALVGATPFWLASRFLQPAVMRLLVKHGADPLTVHRSRYLTGKGFDERTETTTALMAAVGMGRGTPWVATTAGERGSLALETVKLAAEYNVNIGAKDEEGKSALDAAMANRLLDVVRFLRSR